jgi:hypothetical protein
MVYGISKKNQSNTVDTNLLLPFPLRRLCKYFNITQAKSNFPFNLSDINYVGKFPSFEHWTDISQTEYDLLAANYTNSLWSFKDEAIKYCNLDCKCLFDVLVEFNKLVFNQFKVNIHIKLTLPSLAMHIFKSQFMEKNSIYQILGKVEHDIRQAYTGGAVDVYIPHNGVNKSFYSRNKEQLFLYDVNALYPTIMNMLDMPVGKPIAFEGDIRAVEPEAYGFFYCKITSPDFLEHPLLQRS